MEFSRGDVLRFLVVGIRKKGSHTRMDIFSVVSVGRRFGEPYLVMDVYRVWHPSGLSILALI